MTDLQAAIVGWQTQGDVLIIGGDWNNDTMSLDWQNFWTTLGLTAVDSLNHQHSQLTYNQGQKKLDNIYMLPILKEVSGGFILASEAILGADHAALWIDIPSNILKLDTASSTRQTARRLKTAHPAIRDAYLDKYTTFCAQHQLFSWSCALWKEVREGMPLMMAQITEFETIDELRVKGMNLAEQKCRKLRMGQIDWSPDLATSQAKIAAWTAVIRARLKMKVSSHLIHRLLKRAGLQSIRNVTLDQAWKNLHDEFRAYSTLKVNATALRATFLECLATAQAGEKDINANIHLKQLRDQEAQRSLFRHIRAILQTDQRQHGLTYVIDPDGNECHSKESMENACLKENQTRFNQALDTPLLCQPLYGLLGPLGQGPAAAAIHTGTFDHPDIDPVTLQTLNALHDCDYSSLGPTRITVPEYQAIWLHSKERTSSCSKYNLHFGHYIAITHDENLSTLHTQMVDITIMTGYSPM